jgi:hypothetical protein
MTYAISKGDLFGTVISLVGFLIMMKFIEDLEDINNSQETIWPSKEEIPVMHTSRSKKGRSKAD